ncbi:hypothetical protein PDJAM_G00045010 [Pangasius djambal]|uniref:Uncharacterized protein n=1 Tax=Pangasius djambal TaxID=1691987 RepID=A0ACC5YV92_9TELE|nr:hypothetical protein [Pangasius djambal]
MPAPENQRGNVAAGSREPRSDYDVRVCTVSERREASRGDQTRSARTVARASRARHTRRMTLAYWLKYRNEDELSAFFFFDCRLTECEKTWCLLERRSSEAKVSFQEAVGKRPSRDIGCQCSSRRSSGPW